MKRLLRPNETELIGKWAVADGKVAADATAQRIDLLVSKYLEEIATSADGWDTLYRDAQDGRYWELVYPESQMQGGGPPSLMFLTVEEARVKYGDVATTTTPEPIAGSTTQVAS